MNVLHLQRRPFEGQISIERLFAQIRSAFPDHIHSKVHVSPFSSKGVVPRIRNIRAARGETADIFHITGDVHYLAAGLDRRRTILTIHDCASFERLSGVKRKVLKWLWFIVPIRCAANVTTISESTKQELARFTGCDPTKIRVIHNCVGPEFVFCPKPFNSHKPVILQVGTAYNKNIERVAGALKGIHCTFHIIGHLSDTQKALLTNCGINFRNTPRASDAEIVEAYQNCDLLVFASTYEGFGLPILEAQATGRSVITSSLLSMPEVAGKGAMLVDPFSVQDIRKAVQQVMTDSALRERLVGYGLENVRKYNVREIANNYAALYRELFFNA